MSATDPMSARGPLEIHRRSLATAAKRPNFPAGNRRFEIHSWSVSRGGQASAFEN
jgi:hypothetical protein